MNHSGSEPENTVREQLKQFGIDEGTEEKMDERHSGSASENTVRGKIEQFGAKDAEMDDATLIGLAQGEISIDDILDKDRRFQKQRKMFFILLALFFVALVLVVFFLFHWYEARTLRQNAESAYEQALAILDEDPARAVSLLSRSMELGNKTAETKLAEIREARDRFYQYGEDERLAFRYSRAEEYYLLAEKFGHGKARTRIAELKEAPKYSVLEIIEERKTYTAPVLSVSLAPKGSSFLVGDGDSVSWTYPSKGVYQEHATGGEVHSARFSRGGAYAIFSAGDTVRLWKLQGESEGAREEDLVLAIQRAGMVTAVDLSNGSDRIVAGSTDGLCTVWERKVVKNYRSLRGSSGVTKVEFFPDQAQNRVLCGFSDGRIAVWEPFGKNHAIYRDESDLSPILAMAISRDGNRFLTGHKDKITRLWHVGKSTPARKFVGHSDWIRSVDFSSDGKRVLTASDDRTIRLWDADTGEQLLTIEGHADWVRSARFSPVDSNRIISGSRDKTVRFWRIRDHWE
ncbi:MAG: WD40 repeat domain-containing protein [Zoogloeaceae bacterium]|jgi:hypothetical protein|nr:WD40 repeat domain-containing protein [Zoogloeaceae bacterium]